MRNLFFRILELSLAFVYLWVVGDRLGYLGEAGNFGVVWGDFDKFLNYTATLNPWFSRALSDFLGYFVTVVEVVLAAFLIFKFRLKETALASSLLLFTFTLSLIFSLGVMRALDFIIFTVVLAGISVLIYLKERGKTK